LGSFAVSPPEFLEMREMLQKFKGPVLRGLAARASYFHNGSAQTLADVVTFYDARFHIGFTAQERADLIAFSSSL
jgi:cytochrome c peroxidase